MRGRAKRGDVRGVAVIGFDVEPGNSSFSVVGVDENGNVVLRQEGVSLARLLRLVWEHRPRILACDNIYELSADENMLRKILSMLPEDTDVVQVTRSPDGSFADLRSLAAIAGISVDGKLSPSKTAYIAALLALKGYGSRVVFTEEKTKIVIARARHSSAGGMSQQRYRRGVKAGILRATRIIKKILDRHGFDYDLVFRKSGYGLESAVFIVYAPRSALNGLIKRFDGRDIRVEIRPVYTGRIHFETIRERGTKRKYLIVGVDPGIVTGVAAVDLHGNVVFVYSRKGLDRAEIIDIVKKHGEPVLVATDVTPPPENVRKLAASLGVPLYTPPYSLTVDEKQELVAGVRLPARRLNAHERDALAAAIRAYREYSSKFRQIEATASHYPAEISIDNLKASVIRGATIAEALEAEIERLLVEEPPRPVRSVRRHHNEPRIEHTETAERLQRLQEELEAAKARILALEKALAKCREEKAEVENELRLARLEAVDKAEEKLNEYRVRLETLSHELEKTREALRRLEEENRKLLSLIERVARGDYAPVPYIRSLTQSSLKQLNSNNLLHHIRMLYAEHLPDASDAIAEQLSHLGVVAVFSPSNGLAAEALKTVLQRKHIALIQVEPGEALVLGDTALLPSRYVDEAIISYLELLEENNKARNTGKTLTVDELRRLIESYRLTRYREIDEEEYGVNVEQ